MTDILSRLHAEFDPRGAIAKPMFGGVCFMLNGHMVACTSQRGLLVRTGAGFDPVAARRDDCRRMVMRGREMAGYWLVEEAVPERAFRFWMDAALAFNATLAPK